MISDPFKVFKFFFHYRARDYSNSIEVTISTGNGNVMHRVLWETDCKVKSAFKEFFRILSGAILPRESEKQDRAKGKAEHSQEEA